MMHDDYERFPLMFAMNERICRCLFFIFVFSFVLFACSLLFFCVYFVFFCVFFLSPFMLLINVGKCWKSACTVTLLVTKCINPRPGRKLRHETVSVCRVPNEPIVFMYV